MRRHSERPCRLFAILSDENIRRWEDSRNKVLYILRRRLSGLLTPYFYSLKGVQRNDQGMR